MSNTDLKYLEKSFVALLNKESKLGDEISKAFEAIEKKPKAQSNSFEESVSISKNPPHQKSL